MKLNYTPEDLNLLEQIEHDADLLADKIFKLATREKIESFRLSLGTIHNSLRKASVTSGNVIDRIHYLAETAPNTGLQNNR